MVFREITFDDRPLFEGYGSICSDYVFTYLFMYKDIYRLKIAEMGGATVISSGAEKPVFYMPLGDTAKGVEEVIGYCRDNGIKPAFYKIPEGNKRIFEEMGFQLEEDRSSFDYIYKISEFIDYEGKEFRKQRNNLQSYLKAFAPEFTEDVQKYAEQCKEFTKKYHGEPYIAGPTTRMLDNMDSFGLKGGVVLNQGMVAAFCLYEKVAEDMLLSHVELTDNCHRGIHAYLVNELAKVMSGKYINKEDDMGLAGLRRFKESYNPDYMLKKYKALS